MSRTVDAKSMYEKCIKVREDIRIERAKKAVEEGLFPHLDEAIKHTPSPNLMAVAKAIAMGRSNLAKTDPQLKIDAIKFLISDVLGITPEDFLSIWSVDNLKMYNLYACVMGIVEAAPTKLKVDCLFYPQYIFFASVWPERFESLIKPKLSEESIFYCKDLIKGYLMKAGNPNGGKYGNEVDKLLLSSINNEINQRHFANIDEKFEFLSEIRKKSNDDDKKSVGIIDVIKKRGYPSLLDFYFVKMSPSDQQEYYENYLFFREKAKLKREPLIDKVMIANLYSIYFSEPDDARIKEIAMDLLQKGETNPRQKSFDIERHERIEYAIEEYKWIMDSINKKLYGDKKSSRKRSKAPAAKVESEEAVETCEMDR